MQVRAPKQSYEDWKAIGVNSFFQHYNGVSEVCLRRNNYYLVFNSWWLLVSVVAWLDSAVRNEAGKSNNQWKVISNTEDEVKPKPQGWWIIFYHCLLWVKLFHCLSIGNSFQRLSCGSQVSDLLLFQGQKSFICKFNTKISRNRKTVVRSSRLQQNTVIHM